MSPRNALPRPGPRWGPYPQRPESTGTPRRQGTSSLGWPGTLAPWLRGSGLLMAHRAWLDQVRAQALRWQAHPCLSPAWHDAVDELKRQLRGGGLTPDTLAQGLGCVAATLKHTHGLTLHPGQTLAAALMLDQRLVEMPTGEGKTLAMAAAAAVAGMAGIPTHVITANDYLAERDATAQAPLWDALSLRVTHLDSGIDPVLKPEKYRHDIVYCTAKDVAFDYLRDQLRPDGHAPKPQNLQGLCLALLDEADSILLDEAVVPLIISSARQEHPKQMAQRRAIWWQTWSLASQMTTPEDCLVDAQAGRATLTPQGTLRLEALVAHLPGLWQRPRLRQSLMELALTARHALQRDVHYLVREGRIDLLDQVTGRVAQGRVLAQGLQALIELKEGLPPAAPSDTLSQITFQRFFQRYWRLGGLSGTLTESCHELWQVYELAVVRIPPRSPSLRQSWPTRCFRTPLARWAAVAARTQEMRMLGRPVLIGTDTVEDSETLSSLLEAQGVPHVVLNARHDRQEAQIVARSGQVGAVTVATRMAGRGTDIVLADDALRAGGLHVIDCQSNESRRMDRQLWGRCARQGQPGSAETWIYARISDQCWMDRISMLQRCNSCADLPLSRLVTPWLQFVALLTQRMQEHRQIRLRQQLMAQDRRWEQQRQAVDHAS